MGFPSGGKGGSALPLPSSPYSLDAVGKALLPKSAVIRPAISTSTRRFSRISKHRNGFDQATHCPCTSGIATKQCPWHARSEVGSVAPRSGRAPQGAARSFAAGTRSSPAKMLLRSSFSVVDCRPSTVGSPWPFAMALTSRSHLLRQLPLYGSSLASRKLDTTRRFCDLQAASGQSRTSLSLP